MIKVTSLQSSKIKTFTSERFNSPDKTSRKKKNYLNMVKQKKVKQDFGSSSDNDGSSKWNLKDQEKQLTKTDIETFSQDHDLNMTVNGNDKSLKQISTIQFFGKVSLPMQTTYNEKHRSTINNRNKHIWKKKQYDQQTTARIQNFEFQQIHQINKRTSQQMIMQQTIGSVESRSPSYNEGNNTAYQNNILKMILQQRNSQILMNNKVESKYTYMNILKLPHDWNDNYYQISQKEKEQARIKKRNMRAKRQNFEIEAQNEWIQQDKKDYLPQKETQRQRLFRLESKDRKIKEEPQPLKAYYGEVIIDKPRVSKFNITPEEFDAFDIDSQHHHENEEYFHNYVQNTKIF